MKLSELFRPEPLARIQTAIGELCVFTIGYRDIMALNHARPAKSAETSDFMREVARRVCFPPSTLKEDKYKPSAPVLNDEALSKLTDADLETLATSYLEHKQDLYRSRIADRSTDERGVPVYSFRQGEVIHPKNPGESNAQYLQRLF